MNTYSEYIASRPPRFFQSWHGPVFKIHCFTWALAKELKGISGNVTRVDMSEPIPDGAAFTFRALPNHRSPAAKVLRDRVCQEIRQQRIS